MTDGQVGTVVVESGQGDIGVDMYAEVGVCGAEARQARQQPAVGQRMQGGDTQRRDAAAVMQVGGDGGDVGHRGSGGIGKLSAFGREGDAARIALEQHHAEVGFQLAHMVADRAGGQVQLFGGMGEILVTRGSGEHAKGRQQGRAQVHSEFPQDTSQICG
jgi:hypothetical protein